MEMQLRHAQRDIDFFLAQMNYLDQVEERYLYEKIRLEQERADTGEDTEKDKEKDPEKNEDNHKDFDEDKFSTPKMEKSKDKDMYSDEDIDGHKKRKTSNNGKQNPGSSQESARLPAFSYTNMELDRNH